MAKTQTFADKNKNKLKTTVVNLKYIKTVRNEEGNYKFRESFVKLEDISKVNDLVK